MIVGIVASSGGSAFGAACRILLASGRDPNARVLTDRPCGIEEICDRLRFPCVRIVDESREGFSSKAATWLQMQKVDWTCLFFSRLVSRELFDVVPCVNVHPSLLPAFPGMRALEQALSRGVRFVGATAHTVDPSMDGGRVLVQSVATLPPGSRMERLRRTSFAQKVYVFLVLYELFESVSSKGRAAVIEVLRTGDVGGMSRPWACPALRCDRLESAFWDFVAEEGVEWQR